MIVLATGFVMIFMHRRKVRIEEVKQPSLRKRYEDKSERAKDKSKKSVIIAEASFGYTETIFVRGR